MDRVDNLLKFALDNDEGRFNLELQLVMTEGEANKAKVLTEFLDISFDKKVSSKYYETIFKTSLQYKTSIRTTLMDGLVNFIIRKNDKDLLDNIFKNIPQNEKAHAFNYWSTSIFHNALILDLTDLAKVVIDNVMDLQYRNYFGIAVRRNVSICKYIIDKAGEVVSENDLRVFAALFSSSLFDKNTPFEKDITDIIEYFMNSGIEKIERQLKESIIESGMFFALDFLINRDSNNHRLLTMAFEMESIDSIDYLMNCGMINFNLTLKELDSIGFFPETELVMQKYQELKSISLKNKIDSKVGSINKLSKKKTTLI